MSGASVAFLDDQKIRTNEERVVVWWDGEDDRLRQFALPARQPRGHMPISPDLARLEQPH